MFQTNKISVKKIPSYISKWLFWVVGVFLFVFGRGVDGIEFCTWGYQRQIWDRSKWIVFFVVFVFADCFLGEVVCVSNPLVEEKW